MVVKRMKTDLRKRQIIDAARWLIVTYGSEHVTIRKIAAAVGISESAIYRHFRTKEDILLQLGKYIEETLIRDIQQGNNDEQSTIEIIDTILRNHISAIEQHKGVSFQIIAEILSLGDKNLNKELSGVVNRYIEQFAGLLSRGIKSGEIRADVTPVTAATLLFGMIQGLVNIWALNNYSFDLVEHYIPLWNLYKETITASPLLSKAVVRSESIVGII
ncbi:TetR/AcrR family transcriptional regulator [Chloroflexota bacterium]